MKVKIGILGAGQLGTAIAGVLGRNVNNNVVLYSEKSDIVDAINKNGKNPSVFSDYEISCTADENMEKVLSGSKVVFVAVPSFAVLDVVTKAAKYIPSDSIVVLCSKGFNDAGISIEDMFFTNCVKNILPSAKLTVFSGPSFADGVIAGIPTAVNLAADSEDIFSIIRDVFGHHSNVLLYYTSDMTGVQVCAAIKGLIAIKMAILESLQQRISTACNDKDSLYVNKIYKSLSEMFMEMRDIVVALGGKESTIIGPAGIGDTIMVCSSDNSRNKRFGLALGNMLFDKMFDKYKDIIEVKRCFLSGDIDISLLSQNDIKNLLSSMGDTVEGFFAAGKLKKILKNIDIEAGHLEWICDMLSR